MTLARHVPARFDARERIASSVWEVAVFVLERARVRLIGLQLRGIITRLDASHWALIWLLACLPSALLSL